MEQRRVRPHRLARVHHRRQQLVIDLDQADRLGGDVRAARRDGRDRVAAVQDLVLGQDVVAQVAHVGLAQLSEPGARGAVRHVGAGDDRVHPRQRRRLPGIDRLDARVRVGAAEHLAVQQPRQLDIRPVDCAPRYLIPTFLPRNGTADYSGLHYR